MVGSFSFALCLYVVGFLFVWGVLRIFFVAFKEIICDASPHFQQSQIEQGRI